MGGALNGGAKHTLSVVLVQLFVFAELPVHPVGLSLKECSGESWLDLPSVDRGEYRVICDWWWRVRVGPGRGIVFCGVVLVGHDIHLVEVDLGDVGVRGGVYSFGRHHGDDDGLGRE